MTLTPPATGTALDRGAPPSAELHIHIEGTIEPEHIVEMARRNGVALPTEDLDALRARYSFTDLASFLDR